MTKELEFVSAKQIVKYHHPTALVKHCNWMPENEQWLVIDNQNKYLGSGQDCLVNAWKSAAKTVINNKEAGYYD